MENFKVRTQNEINEMLEKVRSKRINISHKPWNIANLRLIDKQTIMVDDEDGCETNKWYGYEANIIILQQMKPINITSLRDICKNDEEIINYVENNIDKCISFYIIFEKDCIKIRPFYKYYMIISDKYKRAKSYASIMKDISYHYNNCIDEKFKHTNKQLKLNNGKFEIYEI